jgi:hypothetical protein
LNETFSAKDLAAGNGRHSLERRASARLHLRETRSGAWIVRDEGNRRGGSFFTLAAALKFIRTEFGAGAQIIAKYMMHKEAA